MRIMVPLDMSEVSSSALEQAVRLADGLGDLLLLVTVADRDTVASVQALARTEGDDPMDVLDVHLQGQAQSVPVSAETELLPGEDPAAVIIDRAHRPDVDMIVMATHGRTGLSRWRLGSITERVIRGSTVPVLVVPAPWRRKLPEVPAGEALATRP